MIFKRKKISDKKLMRESHLKNLMVLAMADGHLSEIEEHFMESVAHRLGFSQIEFDAIKEDIESIKFVLPEKYDERIEQFNDLLSLMAVDGKIDPEEEEICKKFATKYELMDSVYDELIARHQ